jgi:hypothetical protein
LGFQLGDRRLEPLDLRAGLCGKLGVIDGNELARLGELVLLLSKAGG